MKNKKDLKLHTKHERHKVAYKTRKTSSNIQNKKDMKLHTKQERHKVAYKAKKTSS
jgi:hypothetical protein